MNLWQLYIFVSVVEHKSFSKASRMIHLSQPTVSTHIKELEGYFSCTLLDRMGKRTEPTSAGRILYRYARQLLALKAEAESAIYDFLGNTRGHLNIGGSTIPSGYIIPRLIGPFSQKYQGVFLELVTGDTMQIAEKVKTGLIEVGIVGAKLNDTDIRQERLVPDQMRLIVPADHPLTRKTTVSCNDLTGYPIIGREEGSGTWRSVTESINKAGFDLKKLQMAVTMGNTVSVIQGILNGVGISILSTLAVQSEIDQGILKALSLEGVDLNRSFYLTFSARRTLSPIAEKFIAFAESFFHKDKTQLVEAKRAMVKNDLDSGMVQNIPDCG